MKPFRSISLFAVVAVQVFGQSQPAAPVQAESAIRTMLHDLNLAILKADIKTARSLSTARSLGLYDLVFDIVTQVPAAKEQLARVGVKSGRDFFANSLKTAAAAARKSDPQATAQKSAADATIEFRSPTEAVVKVPGGNGGIAQWDGNRWRFDMTESVKQALLQWPLLLQVPAGQRKKLEDY